MDHKTTGLETSWRDGRNRVEIRDVIKNLQNVNKQQSPVSRQARKNNLAVKLFSMEIAESFEEWDDPDIETQRAGNITRDH